MTKEELREEFRSEAFRKRMKSECGTECVNCGQDSVEYHHIVPLACGGTNNLRNIVPLCKVCHLAAHKKIVPKDYITKQAGRKKSKPIDGYKEMLWKYAKGIIGKSELMEKLGEKGHLSEKWWYIEFLEENGIEKIVNSVDMITARRRNNRHLSMIIYKNGEQEKFESQQDNLKKKKSWKPIYVGDMSPEYRRLRETIQHT